jgi:hypothetical protein
VSRKFHLRDCDPRRTSDSGVSFECPEADGGCQGRHAVPGDRWSVTGTLPDMTIDPSVRCRGACQMHIVVTNGVITFADDSKSGPEFS